MNNKRKCQLDQGHRIQVAITIDEKKRKAVIDFTGTSGQVGSNFNAPSAVCIAANHLLASMVVNPGK
jgi:5-oxoprolinase (ATP-hydrolysing)